MVEYKLMVCNKDHGVYYPVYGMVHKTPHILLGPKTDKTAGVLLLFGKSSS